MVYRSEIRGTINTSSFLSLVVAAAADVPVFYFLLAVLPNRLRINCYGLTPNLSRMKDEDNNKNDNINTNTNNADLISINDG
jgi:hypothetical protein